MFFLLSFSRHFFFFWLRSIVRISIKVDIRLLYFYFSEKRERKIILGAGNFYGNSNLCLSAYYSLRPAEAKCFQFSLSSDR